MNLEEIQAAEARLLLSKVEPIAHHYEVKEQPES